MDLPAVPSGRGEAILRVLELRVRATARASGLRLDFLSFRTTEFTVGLVWAGAFGGDDQTGLTVQRSPARTARKKPIHLR